MVKSLNLAVAFACLAGAAPATAQGIMPAVIGATIGNMVAQAREARCKSGTPLPEAEVVEAKTSAQSTMRTYFALAGASETANVSAAFKRGAKGRWVSPEGAAAAKAVNDSSARAFLAAGAATPEPLGFVRAGDGRSARGVWLLTVPSPAGPQALTAYVGDFKRSRGQWKLSMLELYRPAQVPPVVQYCHEPGDVGAALPAGRQAAPGM